MNALRRLAESSTLLHRNVCTYSCTAPVVVADHAMAGHVYRIAQEAIANATKHGKAKHLRLILAATTPDTARLTISDDGTGCPLPIREHRGMGLQIMRYRAGMIGATLRLASNPKGGLRVTCDFFTQNP